MSNGLVTVSNGHATMAKTEGGDVLSAAVQEITKTENKPNVAMVSEHRRRGLTQILSDKMPRTVRVGELIS